MGLRNGVRWRPGGPGAGAVSALQIAPRDYHYTVCDACGRKLYFTYAGETCPFAECGAVVTRFVEGDASRAAAVAAAGARGELDDELDRRPEARRRRRGGRHRAA